MFGMKKSGINAYATVGLETGVVDASPLKLTIMLYEGAITACIQAQQSLAQGDFSKKGEHLTHAASIIESGLRASLNKQNGGQIAQNLDALYQYMSMSLLQANLHKDTSKIQEIQQLLMDLKLAWETLEKHAPAQAARSEAALQQILQHRAQQVQESAGLGNLAAVGA